MKAPSLFSVLVILSFLYLSAEIINAKTTVIYIPVPVNSTASNTTTNATVIQPGSSVLLSAGDMAQISNTNFAVTYATQGEVLTWGFEANNCVMRVNCPCVDVPASKSCLTGYLMLSTGFFYDRQKYCGGNRPSNFTVDSGELTVRYKASTRQVSTGFICFISCTGWGQNVTSPPSVGCPSTQG